MRREKIKAVAAGLCLMGAYYIAAVTSGYFVDGASRALSCTRGAFTLYVTVMAAASIAAAPVYGRLAQKLDLWKILLVGAIVGALAHFAFALCRTVGGFYIAALALGAVQNGCTLYAATVIISRVFAENTGTATGVAMAGTGIGGIVLGAILPTLIERRGYAAGYVLEGAVWLLLYALVLALLYKHPATAPAAPSAAPKSGELEGESFQMAVHEGKFYALLVCVALTMMAATISSLLPSILGAAGFASASVGRLMGLYSLVTLVSKVIVGKLYDRAGPVVSVLTVHIACALSALLIIPGGKAAAVGAVTVGFGVTSGTVLMPLITKSIFGMRSYSLIWSYGTEANVLGVALGTPAWGLVYDACGSYVPGLAAVAVLTVSTALVLTHILKHGRKAA